MVAHQNFGHLTHQVIEPIIQPSKNVDGLFHVVQSDIKISPDITFAIKIKVKNHKIEVWACLPKLI